MPIDDTYYRYYMKTSDFITRLNCAIYGIRDGKQIGFEDFGELVIHCPPLPEQQKIASILAHCDNVVALKQKLIGELRRRKKWLMQMLLDPDSGVRLPGFDGAWEGLPLGNIGEIIIGLTYDVKDICNSDGTLVLRSSNILNGRIVLDDTVYVSTEIPEKLKIQENDILICVRNGSQKLIGKSAIIRTIPVKKCSFGAFMSVYRCENPLFLYFLLQTDGFREQVSKTLGARINQLTSKDLKSFVFYFPKSIPEQAAIANVLSAADNEISLHEQELNEWQKKKKSLMQLLLTGIVRVK